jgi:hypothetical protein
LGKKSREKRWKSAVCKDFLAKRTDITKKRCDMRLFDAYHVGGVYYMQKMG